MTFCQKRRGESARGTAAKRRRWRPINSASSPMRAGNKASISSRRRRARTGEAPPVPIATMTSPRSTIAGKIKLESSGRSTTLTGMRRRRYRERLEGNALRSYLARSLISIIFHIIVEFGVKIEKYCGKLSKRNGKFCFVGTSRRNGRAAPRARRNLRHQPVRLRDLGG